MALGKIFPPMCSSVGSEIPTVVCLSTGVDELGEALLNTLCENELWRWSTAELGAQGWAGTQPVLDYPVLVLHDTESLL